MIAIGLITVAPTIFQTLTIGSGGAAIHVSINEL
jgi:hypothetical protein